MCASPSFQAQRNNEDVNVIQPLFSVNIDHRVSLEKLVYAQLYYSANKTL